jgi:CHAT domain-containing protein
MSKRKNIVSAYFLLLPFCLLAQCPARDSLWNRIIFLRDSSASSSIQLKKLLELEAKTKNCPYQNDSAQAFLLQRIGYAYYAQMDFLRAIEYTNRAVGIINSNRDKKFINPQRLVDCYYNLAVYFDSLKQVYRKNSAIDSCIATSVKTNYGYYYSLYLLKGRSEDILDNGDYQRGFNYASLGESLAKRSSLYNYVLNFSTIKANALVSLGKFDAAEEVLEKNIGEIKKNKLGIYLGTIYEQLAELELKKGNEKKSLDYFQKSLQLNKKIGFNLGCQQALTNLGYLLYFKYYKDHNKALDCYRKAIRYLSPGTAQTAQESFELLNLQANIANVYVREGNYDSAFYYFQRAFDIVQPGIDEEGIVSIYLKNFQQYKKIDLLVSLILDKADAYLSKYKQGRKRELLEKAIAVYKTADKFFDIARKDQLETLSKLFWRMQHRRLYEHAIETCFLSGNFVEAFHFFERSKAVLLNDQLSEQYQLGEEDILNLAQLRKKTIQMEKEVTGNISSSQLTELERSLFISKQDLVKMEQQIKERNPLYYQSFLDTEFIKLKDVKNKLLQQYDVILELFNGDSSVYALLITRRQTLLYYISKPDFDKTVEKYTYYLSDPAGMNAHFDDYVQTAHYLYKMIFQNTQLPAGRIIISSDGQYFPFEALVTSKATQPLTYFLKDHAVGYTYSARFLMNDFIPGPSITGKSFLGFAPVNYPPGFSLAPLPGSERSLNKIAGYFENTVSQVASHASRGNFLQQFSQYRIIQLYTHAAGGSNNNEPVIYFADSALYLSDIISGYKPLTRLIVLSACETGTGKNYQGEGVFSFNRGFAALGIPAAITNLWSVDNEATYTLTELFYKWLAKGLPTDIALQKAKLEFMETATKEKSMPCYWAGPVLVGKADIIELRKTYSWKWIVFFAGIGCVVFLSVRKAVISRNK